MSQRNTLARTCHDLGLAAWFGGTLMGAVGLNGAASSAADPAERLELSSRGWLRWAPVQIAALTVHAVGGVGLLGGNKARLATQTGGQVNTIVKLAITGAAVASTVWSGVLGKKIAQHASEGAEGVTEAGEHASTELRTAHTQQRYLQWVTPALTAVLIVLGAQQGEQQRPFAGLLKR